MGMIRVGLIRVHLASGDALPDPATAIDAFALASIRSVLHAMDEHLAADALDRLPIR